MKMTKMEVTGQLGEQGADKLTGRFGASYVIAARAAALGALAAIIHAIRWW